MKYKNFLLRAVNLLLILGVLWQYQQVALVRAAAVSQRKQEIAEVEAYNASVLQAQSAAQAEQSQSGYRDGTYEGSAFGFGDVIRVSVTIQSGKMTVIDRCVHVIYRKYFENPIPENMPLLEDLYNALLTQDEPEARHVAAALEIYVKGSLNIFNHHTNVDINNRIVCFDIKQLGKQLKKLGMLIVQDAVWGRVTANRSAGKSTRYYADEFHLLLKEEQTAAYSVEIWKRFRKWGGIPTALTQNVKDLLASPEVSNIFENSDFVYMLNQANGDRQILAKQLNISPHQLSYVTHSGEGEGLLFFGNVILPFVDHFPKDLELYRILTTRLSEVAEAQKHE